MKKLLIIVVILSLITIIGMAKLSDETLKMVEDLRWKHYMHGLSISSIKIDDTVLINDSNFEYEWWSFYFKDGKLFVETQDGKWFIEMEKIE